MLTGLRGLRLYYHQLDMSPLMGGDMLFMPLPSVRIHIMVLTTIGLLSSKISSLCLLLETLNSTKEILCFVLLKTASPFHPEFHFPNVSLVERVSSKRHSEYFLLFYQWNICSHFLMFAKAQRL